MKKSLIALAALAVVSAASAQSSVTISGSVAAAYERTSVIGDKADLTGFDPSSNNITFKGVEDLGGGLKAGFELNKRFDLPSGNVADATNSISEFENSYLYLESATMGRVAFGRHQNASFSSYDPFGALGGATNGESASTSYGNNNQAGARQDSLVSYTSPVFSGFKVTYGQTVNPTVNTGDEYSVVKIDYSNGPISASVGHENNSSLVGVAGTKDKQAAASYDFGMAKVALVWSKKADNSARTAVHATVPVNAALKVLATYRAAGDRATAATVAESAFAIGAEYSLSKRTTAFAHYGDSGLSTLQTAYRIGLRHTF